jgi:cold shock protein
MPTGRVKFFNKDRGFGFIVPDGGGADVFVHVHDVEVADINTLVRGQVLVYDTAEATSSGSPCSVHDRRVLARLFSQLSILARATVIA